MNVTMSQRRSTWTSFLWFLLAPTFAACSRAPSSNDAPATGIVCRVSQLVYHNAWEKYGEVSVSTSAEYSWKVRHIWSDPPWTETFTGHLPASVATPLQAASSSFELLDGVRVYNFCIDDHRTSHPPAVTELLRYLRQTHLSTE